jgi:hypothetical protein
VDSGRFFALASAAAVFSYCSTADAAPSQLLNKTVSVTTTVTIPARGSDGTISTRQRTVSRLIYISSQGRLFVKVSQRARRAATDREIGPGDGGSWPFEGNRLVTTRGFISGANQLTISFDPSFQSCSADLVIGSESGKPRVWKALNGETLTAAGKAEVSGVSCSIQEGNAFAN